MRRGRRGRRTVHPIVAALIVILGTVAITYYAFNDGLPFVHGFRVRAIVSEAQSLDSQSPVRIAGVDVGTVDGVSRDAGGTAVVTMDLDNSALPLHADATVRIRPRLFLEGSSYVDLFPGTPAAPTLRQGATIPLAHTSVAVQAYQLFSTLDLPTRSSLVGVLHVLSQALADGGVAGLRAAQREIAPALKDVAWISQSARGTAPDDLANFVRTAASVTATLARNRSQVADSVTRLNTVAGALAATGNALGESVSGLDQVLRQAPPDLAAIDRALPPLTSLGRALNPVLAIAPPLIRRVSDAVSELQTLVAPAERARLVTALRGVFVALPSLVQRLGGLFGVVTPLADCIRTHLAPILLAKVPDGSLSTGQPVWQEFAHALVGLSGASQNFDANGYALRILVGAGAETVTAVLPGLGKVVGTLPGGTTILGARPRWIGDLTASDFQPGAPCAAQPLPNLASSTGPPDFSVDGQAAAPTLSRRALDQLLGELRRAVSR